MLGGWCSVDALSGGSGEVYQNVPRKGNVSIFPNWYQPFARSAMAGKDYRQVPGHHAMLFSYFDDSSDKRREQYFACGGLLGHESQWLTFDLRWIDATHELDKPFRSTECEGGHGQ